MPPLSVPIPDLYQRATYELHEEAKAASRHLALIDELVLRPILQDKRETPRYLRSFRSSVRQCMKARAFCLSVRGFVSRPVRETLALDTLSNERRTFPVCHLAGVPLEIPFCEIARQMGFADRMMRTKHRALHEAERRSVGLCRYVMLERSTR